MRHLLSSFPSLFALVIVLALPLACDTKSSSSDDNASPGDGDGDSHENGDGDEQIDGSGGAAPEEIKKGERGSSCDRTSDCADELSCIVTQNCPVGVACANKTCQPSNFDIIGTGMQCYVSDCSTKGDCCGDLPQVSPEKCIGRDAKCFEPTLADCIATSCTESTDCGSGECVGYCQYDSTVDCTMDSDCEADTCIVVNESDPTNNYCAVTGVFGCVTDDDCYDNICSATRYCDCTNPDYNPDDPICEDVDCEGICGFTCEYERCVVDDSCQVDDDCDSLAPYCEANECVECLSDDDCDEEQCILGRCGPECETDTQCSLFEVCQDSSCVYVGCQSDRECVLSNTSAESGQDPRLFVCNIAEGVGTCVFPCEIDAQCASTEICFESRCEYIGCETDAECKTITGLHNQPVPTDERPWTSEATCRAESPGL